MTVNFVLGLILEACMYPLLFHVFFPTVTVSRNRLKERKYPILLLFYMSKKHYLFVTKSESASCEMHFTCGAIASMHKVSVAVNLSHEINVEI